MVFYDRLCSAVFQRYTKIRTLQIPCTTTKRAFIALYYYNYSAHINHRRRYLLHRWLEGNTLRKYWEDRIVVWILHSSCTYTKEMRSHFRLGLLTEQDPWLYLNADWVSWDAEWSCLACFTMVLFWDIHVSGQVAQCYEELWFVQVHVVSYLLSLLELVFLNGLEDSSIDIKFKFAHRYLHHRNQNGSHGRDDNELLVPPWSNGNNYYSISRTLFARRL